VEHKRFMTDKSDKPVSLDDSDEPPVKQLIVMVDKSHINLLDTISEKLEHLGMMIEMKMPISGMITGTVRGDMIESIATVSGVEYVREDGELSVIASHSDSERAGEELSEHQPAVEVTNISTGTSKKEQDR